MDIWKSCCSLAALPEAALRILKILSALLRTGRSGALRGDQS